jgi:hypothetical protein
MDKLLKTLDKLSTLMKQVNAKLTMPKLPKSTTATPSLPSIPKIPSGPATNALKPPTMPKVTNTPASKKDPVNIAQQTQDTAIKPTVMDEAKRVKESMRVSKHGQWSIIKTN